MQKIFDELRRRNIFRVAGVYGASSWLIIQLGIAFETSLNLPGWFDRLLTTLVLLGFPIALILAWAFELTPEGLKRTEIGGPSEDGSRRAGRKLGIALIALISVVIGLITWRIITSEVQRQNDMSSAASSNGSTATSVTEQSAMDALRTIAVMPFENLADDERYDYISSGLSSSIRDDLAGNRLLRVVARSSSQAVANESLGALEIAERLNVANVLEGRVEKRGEKLLITVSLVDARTGFTRWVETLTYDPEALIDIRDKITSVCAQTLSVDQRSQGREPGDATVPEAFTEYFRGTTLLYQEATLESLESARRHLETAVQLDPGFADAHSSLAGVYLILGAVSADKGLADAMIDKSEAMAREAIALAPSDADTHAVLGEILMSGRVDMVSAAGPFDQAQALGLSSGDGLSRHAVFLSATGRHDEAIEQAYRAKTLDPLSASASETLGLAYYADRQFGSAITAYRLALSQNPERYTTRARLGLAHIYSGSVEDGLDWCSKEENLMERLPCEAAAAVRKGESESAEKALGELIEVFGDAGAYQQAEMLAEMGQTEVAIATLLKAESLGDTGLAMAGYDPALDNLRDDERFQALLVRLGLSD